MLKFVSWYFVLIDNNNNMKEHKNLLTGSSDEDHFEDGLYECWQEKWSNWHKFS